MGQKIAHLVHQPPDGAAGFEAVAPLPGVDGAGLFIQCRRPGGPSPGRLPDRVRGVVVKPARTTENPPRSVMSARRSTCVL